MSLNIEKRNLIVIFFQQSVKKTYFSFVFPSHKGYVNSFEFFYISFADDRRPILCTNCVAYAPKLCSTWLYTKSITIVAVAFSIVIREHNPIIVSDNCTKHPLTYRFMSVVF